MRISLIAALARNRVIGRNNQLPWRLSADLQHFKTLTMGKPIIMGRKTFESIGKPLPGRTNIVLTRERQFLAQGCVVVHDIDQALQVAAESDEVMIIGGANLYRQFLPRADRLYLTEVKAEVTGDTWFPDLDITGWTETERVSHQADEKNEYDYDFVILDRKR
jgi:dihydrofolate reductase